MKKRKCSIHTFPPAPTCTPKHFYNYCCPPPPPWAGGMRGRQRNRGHVVNVQRSWTSYLYLEEGEGGTSPTKQFHLCFSGTPHTPHTLPLKCLPPNSTFSASFGPSLPRHTHPTLLSLPAYLFHARTLARRRRSSPIYRPLEGKSSPADRRHASRTAQPPCRPCRQHSMPTHLAVPGRRKKKKKQGYPVLRRVPLYPWLCPPCNQAMDIPLLGGTARQRRRPSHACHQF